MIRHIIKKDWTLLWPLVVLVAAIQVGFDWAVFEAGFFGGNPVADELVRLLSGAWMVGVVALAVATVHEDAIPGAEQDWLVRPLVRTDLVLAKLIFVLVTVCAPMLAANFAHELAMGFPVLASLQDASYKELYVFLCLLVPAMALAAVTRNMTELLVFAAALVVLFAATLGVSATLFGADRCPTCDTSIAWLQHLLQHAGVLVGSAVILALQYFRRRTEAARLVAAVGVVLLVIVQIPWDVAFSIQSRLAGGTDAALPVSLSVDADEDTEAAGAQGMESASGRGNVTRAAARALLHGNVGGVMENLKQFRHPDDMPVVLSLPLRVTGTTRDQFLVSDRAEFSLIDPRGRVLYRGTNTARGAKPLLEESGDSAVAPGVIQLPVEIPVPVYRHVWTHAARLGVDFSLTLMVPAAQYRLSALDGELRASELGVCRSKADRNGIRVRCQQIGRGPICYSATLYGPDGRHNPDELRCSADYRPYIPSPTDILDFSGVDLPTRDPSGLAHYAVDVSDLPRSHILLKVYVPRVHLRRSLETSAGPAR